MKIQPKILRKEQGFTLIEVIVAMLITSGFLAVCLQMMVLSTAIRVVAQRKIEANKWIQEDIEILLSQTSEQALPTDRAKCSATNYNDGYAKALSDRIESFSMAPHRVQGTINYTGHTYPSSEILGKVFALERFYASATSTAPHKTLRVEYKVREWNGISLASEPIASYSYLEVIPDAALECF